MSFKSFVSMKNSLLLFAFHLPLHGINSEISLQEHGRSSAARPDEKVIYWFLI